MSENLTKKLQVIGIYLFILFMFIVIAYPLLWLVGVSLNEGSSMFSLTIIPENPSLKHYEWLFTNPSSEYKTWYLNSLYVAVVTSIASVIITSCIAFAFSRYRFVGKKYGLYAFLILNMFPSLMGMVALYVLLYVVGLLDNLWGLILIYVGGQIPFNAWLTKGYFDTIPLSLDEAARIDGAGHMQTFIQIILPLAKPILGVVALFNFMAPFTDFLLPRIVLTSPEHLTLAVGLQNFVNDEFDNQFTLFAAGSVLIALPIATIYLFLQRWLISGLTSGATKG